MSFLDQVTPIVITWNEEPNIKRVLDRLTWAHRIVVVDSGSTDATLEILGRYPNVRVLTRPFVSHADQVNFALREGGIATEWVLSIDADYIISDALHDGMARLAPPSDVAGYSTRFEYWALGRPLRSSLYPARTTLFRRSQGEYEQEGHAHRLRLRGRVSELLAPIYHDDRKPLARWIIDQERYATLEDKRLLLASRRELDLADRIRRTGLLAPALVAIYCLILKGCALDGRAGLHYTLQRVVAEALLAMRLWELRSR